MMQHCSRLWQMQSDAMRNSFLQLSLFRLLTNELNSLVWAKMSTDEYLSSPILQSQRVWCEGNVILMRPTGPAPSGSRHWPIIWCLSPGHTPGSVGLCGANICFKPRVTCHDDQWSIPPLNGSSNPRKLTRWFLWSSEKCRWAINNFVSRSISSVIIPVDISKMFQTLKCLWLWDLYVCNVGLCSGNRDILWIFETPKLENKQLEKI